MSWLVIDYYQLAILRKGNSSISDYFHCFTHLIDTLAAIDQPLPFHESLSFLLAGLGTDYDSLVTSVQTQINPIPPIVVVVVVALPIPPFLSVDAVASIFREVGGMVNLTSPLLQIALFAKCVTSPGMWHYNVITGLITHINLIILLRCRPFLQLLNNLKTPTSILTRVPRIMLHLILPI